MQMDFEWDPDKSESNLLKHGISFEEALRVFADTSAIEEYDDRYEEERWQTIGRIGKSTVVLVAHTIRTDDGGTVVRIISARPAEKREREKYEQR